MPSAESAASHGAGTTGTVKTRRGVATQTRSSWWRRHSISAGWLTALGIAILWIAFRSPPADSGPAASMDRRTQVPQPPAMRPPPSEVAPAAPRCSADPTLRPPSSSELGGHERAGYGRLQVSNGTDYDAVAVLVANGSPKRAIYIREGERGLIAHIPAGSYILQFQLGTSWLAERRFCAVAGTSEFERPLDFEDDGRNYTTFEATLNPVLQGNARTRDIPATAFDLPSP